MNVDLSWWCQEAKDAWSSGKTTPSTPPLPCLQPQKCQLRLVWEARDGLAKRRETRDYKTAKFVEACFEAAPQVRQMVSKLYKRSLPLSSRREGLKRRCPSAIFRAGSGPQRRRLPFPERTVFFSFVYVARRANGHGSRCRDRTV